jgi:signal transduction histidine kinase
MIEEAFQHRSGRIIAFGRAVLAIFFLIVIWVDRTQPHAAVSQTYAFLGFYVAASVAALLLTWNDWWLESRLAAPFHVIDLMLFLWLNYATEGYASPFFTFFVFLIFSATFRWGWRGTAATAAIIIVLYIASAVTAASGGPDDFDWRRFALRSAYLVVLTSMTMLWIASTRHGWDGGREARRLGGDGGGGRPDLAPLLARAAERFGATRALCIWSEDEEPWTWVSTIERGRFEEARLEPDAYAPAVSPEAPDGPFLFDQGPGRILSRAGTRGRSARPLGDPVHRALAAEHGVRRGLRIPIRSGTVTGDLFVLDVPGLCSDDLQIAEHVAVELDAALEHRELIGATEQAAAVGARLSLARDLHDSVVQFLAGLAFRLEGLRKTAAAGGDVAGDVDSLQAELAREQQDLRRFIAELREGPAVVSRDQAELVSSLRELTARIAAQWGVACRLTTAPAKIEVPVGLERNVRQLVREAVANAVRHGRATAIDARLSHSGTGLGIEISDNGSGFALQGEFAPEDLAETGPSSLRERVHNLGGRLRIASAPSGSRLTIDLPLEGAS